MLLTDNDDDDDDDNDHDHDGKQWPETALRMINKWKRKVANFNRYKPSPYYGGQAQKIER